MKNIGILSYWGWHRGISYTTRFLYKTLRDDYNVFILKQGNNKDSEEFIFKENSPSITEYPTYVVDPGFFKNWVEDNKLDAVIFHEFNQWGPEPYNLPKMVRDMGKKAYGYLTTERFKVEQASDYDRIFAPTVSFERFLRVHRIRNFTYIPRSIDLNEFPDPTKQTKDPSLPFTFLHPGGWGGVQNRKSTDVVIEAFERLDNPDTKLIIASQKKLQFDRELHPNIEIIDKDLSRQELIDLYYKTDCTVLPSKWETIGIPILESLAAGRPLIVTNIPPMSEFIRPGLNGYLCKPTLEKYPDISIYAAIVDPITLKVNMENMLNKTLYPMLSRNSRAIAEQFYSLETNKHYLLNFLKKDV